MILLQRQGRIYPSTMAKSSDDMDNIEISKLHTQRMDGAWCANKRILAQIKYWMEYYGI